MCGGLVAILGAAPGAKPVVRLAIYNLARVNALVAIGALAGGLGTSVVAWGPVDLAGRVLSVGAGVVTFVIGLEVLGVSAPRGQWLAQRLHRGLGHGLGTLLHARSIAAPVAFGSLNALLPCHLIYAFAALAAATASIGEGAATMLAFGLGTVPAMMAPGVVREWMPRAAGGRLVRLAGALVVVVGMLTVARGLGPAPGLHHH
jgi:hypothetical protein